jgi:hypothetical protein
MLPDQWRSIGRLGLVRRVLTRARSESGVRESDAVAQFLLTLASRRRWIEATAAAEGVRIANMLASAAIQWEEQRMNRRGACVPLEWQPWKFHA